MYLSVIFAPTKKPPVSLIERTELSIRFISFSTDAECRQKLSRSNPFVYIDSRASGKSVGTKGGRGMTIMDGTMTMPEISVAKSS
jgi:hypothetical protein